MHHDYPKVFEKLGLTEPLVAAAHAMGWSEPTPIQGLSIPLVLTGKDILGCAQTGTGKTGAFTLPIVQRLAGTQKLAGLVLCPTRELAIQIQDQFLHFGPAGGITSALLIGGESMRKQLDALGRHPQVIVATPGRLIDHLERKSCSLKDISTVVLDEGDRMLDMGFFPQIMKILRRLPKTHQTLLFSATMPGAVERLIDDYLDHPIRIDATPTGTPASGAEQALYLVDLAEKRRVLLHLLDHVPGPTLIFTRTRRDADTIARFLDKAGHHNVCMHSDRTQSHRKEALQAFKDEKVRILVATDIVARGIDVVDIAHVINYNVPENPDDYVHRIGRTARAFKTGLASTIASLEELVELRAIDQTLGEPVPRKHVPGIKTFEERPKQKTGRLRPMSPRRAGIKRRW